MALGRRPFRSVASCRTVRGGTADRSAGFGSDQLLAQPRWTASLTSSNFAALQCGSQVRQHRLLKGHLVLSVVRSVRSRPRITRVNHRSVRHSRLPQSALGGTLTRRSRNWGRDWPGSHRSLSSSRWRGEWSRDGGCSSPTQSPRRTPTPSLATVERAGTQPVSCSN